MTTYTHGALPADVVTDKTGRVTPGVVLTLYGSQSDAVAQTNLLYTAVTDANGRWTTSTVYPLLYVRDPMGNVWPNYAQEEDSTQDSRLTALESGSSIVGGTTAQYYRGDKTWATLNTAIDSHVNDPTASALFLNPGDVRRWGAKWDGSTNDAAAVQAAHDALPAGSTLFLPSGNGIINTALSVTKGITIRGGGSLTCRLVASGCNGINVTAGVTGFHVENLEIAQSVRYSTTANTLIGINIDGLTGSRPASHVYRDVYIDGFQTAIRTRYLWSSVFDNVTCNYGLIGMAVYGLSVNNVVANCGFSVGIVAGSRGISLLGRESATDATAVASEGWTIHDTLVYGGEINVEIMSVAHVDIHDCILDFSQQYGVRIYDNGTHFAGNLDIHDNYIAMTGTGGVAAIQSANTIANTQNTVNKIHDNHMLVYSGSTCTYGLNQSGSNGLFNAHDNTFNGFSTQDILTQSSGNRIVGNRCQSSLANNIAFIDGQINEIHGNTGVVYNPGVNGPIGYAPASGRKVAHGNTAPTVGTWAVGDRLVNATPAVGSPKAWTCTVAGTPGTWVSEGNL